MPPTRCCDEIQYVSANNILLLLLHLSGLLLPLIMMQLAPPLYNTPRPY